MLSRRNALTIMGLAAPGAALAAEDFTEGKKAVNELPVGADATKKQMTAAMHALGDAIGRGDISVTGLNVSTDIERISVIKQRLYVDFIINQPTS